MVHICKGNFPVFGHLHHCNHRHYSGGSRSTINIFNSCSGNHTSFGGGFVAGLGFSLGGLFNGLFGGGIPMFGGAWSPWQNNCYPMYNITPPWQSFGMDQIHWNGGRNNGSTDVTNKGSNNSNNPGDAKADFIDEDNNKIVAIEEEIKKANTPEVLQKTIDELNKLKKEELTDHYKNDKRVEELGIDKLISDAEAKKAKLAAEKAQQQQQQDPVGVVEQPGSPKAGKQQTGTQEAEAPAKHVSDATQANNGNVATVQTSSNKKIPEKLKDLGVPEGYAKIEKFEIEKSVYAHDDGKPADVNPTKGKNLSKELENGFSKNITITDSEGEYKYSLIGITTNGVPIYNSEKTNNYYALVQENDDNNKNDQVNEYVLLQTEFFGEELGYNIKDEPDYN